jgi:ribonuclease HII
MQPFYAPAMDIRVGIDEAGRGCVIGPLVVACVSSNESDRRWFSRMNIRDSKLVPAEEREVLVPQLMERCWHAIRVIYPPDIDRAVRDRSRTLNGLELEHMAELLKTYQALHPEHDARAIIDAPSINKAAVHRTLTQQSAWHPERLFAEHKADRRHRTVAAASLIAKFERERLITELKRELKIDFGCGYPHDKKTQSFLRTCPPTAPYIRWTWKTMSVDPHVQF